jgi:hypothetical protein
MSPAARSPDPADPKGLIREAFRIEGISPEECRSIFVDWALSVEAGDPRAALETLLARHADAAGDHPMLAVLREGLLRQASPVRRGGRAARVKTD